MTCYAPYTMIKSFNLKLSYKRKHWPRFFTTTTPTENKLWSEKKLSYKPKIVLSRPGFCLTEKKVIVLARPVPWQDFELGLLSLCPEKLHSPVPLETPWQHMSGAGVLRKIFLTTYPKWFWRVPNNDQLKIYSTGFNLICPSYRWKGVFRAKPEIYI